MPLLRPLDLAFPIERQLAVDVTPVVLMNVFALDKADEEAFLQAWRDDAAVLKQQPGFISTQASPRNRRKPDLFELCGLEIDRLLPGRVHASAVQGENLDLSVLGCCFPAPVPEGRGARDLRCIARRASVWRRRSSAMALVSRRDLL